VKPSTTPAPEDDGIMDAWNNSGSPTTPTASSRAASGTIVRASDNRPPQSAQQVRPPRREVLSAMRAAKEMPPYAFQRRIDSGLYSDFSPEEQALVSNAAQFPLAWDKR